MQHPVWPLLLALLCAASFWCGWRVEHPNPERSFESVITLGSSVVRDMQTPLRMALEMAIPVEEEMRIGKRLARPYLDRAEIGTAELRQLKIIGQELTRGVRRKGIRYRFVLLADPEAHAFAICGGYVFVTRGMVELCENHAELAGVLGHEIAHIDLGHTASLVWEEKLRDPTGIVKLADHMTRLGYSEEMEREADMRGVLLAEQSGYYPAALIDLFTRLEDARSAPRRPGGKGVVDVIEKSLDAYLATHPSFARRIETIEALIAENRSSWTGKRYILDPREMREFR